MSKGLILAQEREMISFFFDVGESQPTQQSLKDLDSFNLFIDKHPLVILEINSYSSKDGSVEINQQIAEHRLYTIKAFLNPSAKILKTNIYGVNYSTELINKFPVDDYVSWRRVDVLFTLKKVDPVYSTKDTLNNTTEINDKTIQISDYIDTNSIRSIQEEEEVYEKKLEKGDIFQMELRIQFIDGTYKLTKNSYPEIEKLANYMKANPNVYAFVRGHVCCGKAMRLSRKRAKVVYIELKKQGVNRKRIRYQGFSNNLPLVSPERSEADRRKNRRVDILFSVKN